MFRTNKFGFTLIELLIVIAIIAVLAGVVFVSLDPLKRFADARDSRRWSDVTAILSAIKVDQVDNGGAYLPALDPSSATRGEFYVIGTNGATGCDNICSAVTTQPNCLDLAGDPSDPTSPGLVNEGYLGTMPISPNGPDDNWSEAITGYYVSINTNGSATVGACTAEGAAEIAVTR